MSRGFVYILKGINNSRFYIGSTTDIARRVRDHKAGKVKVTRNLRPINLEFYQEYASFGLARKVESRLKRLKRKDYIKRIIKDSLIKMGL